MNRKGSDLLKTVGAIVVVGGIVVATFLYGNKQRQEQVRHDQQIRQQQEQKAAQDSSPKVAVDNSKDKQTVKPETQAPKTATPANNQTTSKLPAPAHDTQLATGGGNGTASDSTPKTGGELYYLIPVAVIVGLYQVNRSRRGRLRKAFLKN